MVEIITGLNDLATVRPDLMSEWHPTKNAGIDPSKIYHKDTTSVWWICKCGHEYRSKINKKKPGKCPRCTTEYHTSFPEKVFAYYLRQGNLY